MEANDAVAGVGIQRRAHDLLVVADEVWEHVVFDGRRHTSVLAIPDLRARSVKIGSAGKICSMTGWKSGWAVAAAPLARAVACVVIGLMLYFFVARS